MGWMALSGALFAVMTGIARHVSIGLDPMQAAFLRYAFGLLFVVPFLFGRHGFVMPRTSQPWRHAARGFVHGFGVMAWFYGLTRIPLADVQALSFLAPIFVTIGAILFLGERVDPRRIAAVLIAFAGTLVILRPTGRAIDPGAIALLLTAPLAAASELIAKTLTRTESSANVVFFQSIFVSLTCLPMALVVWAQPTLEQIGWIVVVAGLATLGHIAWMKALIAAEVSVTQPVKFLQLPMVALVGFLAFSEVPDAMTLLGGAIIFLSATYVAGREARRGT